MPNVAKRYHRETGTETVLAIFSELTREIRISRLTFVELQSVFAMKVRSGFIRASEAEKLRARLLVDIAADEIEVCGVKPEHFAAAERLIRKHGFSHRLRTLDAIQLAVALDLTDRGLADFFVFSDKALAEVATFEGLSVMNPES